MERTLVQISADPKLTSQVVSEGLRAFNRTFLGETGHEPIAVEVIGPDGDIVGGASGSLHLGWLFVDVLWLPEDLRGYGVGTRILGALEAEAIRRGAHRALLSTMTFQAENFYVKQGYLECGRLENFAAGHDRLFMTKTLGALLSNDS